MAGQRILAGDWDGDGVASLGFYDPATGTFQLWNDDPKSKPDYEFVFGPAGAGLQPIAGDWDGDGIDTVGLYDPQTGKVWLRNQNKAGSADVGFLFKLPIKNGIAVAGDWTSKGYDSVGVYDPATSVFYLKDTNKSGGPDHGVKVDPKGPGALPLSGDWDDTGFSRVGLYDPASGEVRLRTTLTSGAAQYTRTFVTGLEQVFTGRWNATKHAPGGKQKIKRGSKPAVGIDFEDGDDSSQVRLNLTPVSGPSARPPAKAASQTRPLHTQATTATANWNYTIRDESNRPSIEYHLGPLNGFIVDRLYAYLGDRLIATYEFQPQTDVPSWIYHTADHLGSVRLAGTTKYDYWPFGEKFVPDPPNSSTGPLRFAHMERDPASGNDYDHARYCSSPQGRFLSPDKVQGMILDPQSWNRYAYARNNPLLRVDPDGLKDTIFQEASATLQAGLNAIAPVTNYASSLPVVGQWVEQGVGMAGLAARTLNLGTATGEAIGSGADAFTLTNAISSDVLTASEFTLAVAGTARSLGVGGEASTAGVLENKAKGDAFRDQIAQGLRQEGRQVQTEVVKKTPFGRRVVDIEVSKDGKVLGGVETKLPKSRYRPDQRAKDEYLRRQGYCVNVARGEPCQK